MTAGSRLKMDRPGAMKQNPEAATRFSFRDPSGALFSWEGRILRIVGPEGQGDLAAFLGSQAAKRLIASGHIVQTWQVDSNKVRIPVELTAAMPGVTPGGRPLLFEHQKVPFVSYPYEWAPEMLYAAAELTLQLAEDIGSGGFGLKDATPYNVLFVGPNPVFIDLLSFEKRDPRDATWLPYAQFVRTFLLPLQASRLRGVPLDQLLMSRRDGLEPEELYRWLSPFRRIMPPCLTLVTLPKWLAGSSRAGDGSIYKRKLMKDPEQAAFIFRSLLRGLRQSLRRSSPVERKSRWTGYMESGNTYSEDSFQQKESFVRGALEEFAPRSVLDVGCNTGHFSFLSAGQGARVVAIDYDPAVIGRVWKEARVRGLDILPLAVNITRPSPAMGWMNHEHASFLERARASFDMVLMLAVIHHMLVSERVPLAEIIRLASELTNRLAVIEYVDPADPMFRRIARGRDHLHKDLTPESFEADCCERFEILRSQGNGTRRLYLLRKK
jgi:SAM-dependent methyltransferase